MRPSPTAAFVLCLALVAYNTSRAEEISAATALVPVNINDPQFGGKKAFTVNIPAGWHLEGTVVAGLNHGLPSPAFRAYSPDGLTEMRLLPAFNWLVLDGSKPAEGFVWSLGFIWLERPLTAAEFLERYAHTLFGVRIVGPAPVGAGYQQQLDVLLLQMNDHERTQGKTRTTGDAAAWRLEVNNGTFTLEERLRARVLCTVWQKTEGGRQAAESCTARMDVLRTPKGRLDGLIAFADAHNLATARHEDAWLAELAAHMRNAATALPPDEIRLAMLRNDSAAVLFLQARDFGLIAPERSWAMEPVVLRSTKICEYDWTDHALRISSSHGTGTTGKSGPEHVWSSADGQKYVTCNPGANPTGVLPGEWTDQLAVPREAGPQ